MESITDWAFSWPISVEVGVSREAWEVWEARIGGQGGLRTLVVIDDVAQVVAARVMGFAHAHGVVREVDIAVVAWRVRTRLWRRNDSKLRAVGVGAYKRLIPVSKHPYMDRAGITYILASLRRCGELAEASILDFAEVKEVLSLALRRANVNLTRNGEQTAHVTLYRGEPTTSLKVPGT